MPPHDPLAPARAAMMRQDAAGAIRAAEPLCDAPDLRVRSAALALCGEAMFQLGHTNSAIQFLHASLHFHPDHIATRTALGRVLMQCGRTREAIPVWRHVAVRIPGDPAPWLHLAECHRLEGDHLEAATAVRTARTRAPGRSDLVRREVEDLQAADRLDEAHTVVMEALPQFPDHVDLNLMAAERFASIGNRDHSLLHLNRAVASNPRDLTARSRRTNHFVQTRQLDRASEDLAVMVSIDPRHHHVQLQKARLDMARGNPNEALETLNQLLSDAHDLPATIHGNALLHRAELHGKQGHPAREWLDLTRAQQLLAQPQLQRGDDGSDYLELVHQQTARLQPDSGFLKRVGTMPVHPPDGAALLERPPVFMFGFPRSGTTLAERVLGAHPNLTATDELNLLGAVCQSIAHDFRGTPSEELSDAQVLHLRQVFVRKAIQAGYDPSTTRLIDKNPLNLICMDVVRRVFPDAPVLMLLRDPRDCCWSAFRQAFQPNPALVLTRDLEGTATLYRAILDHWQWARSIPGLRVTEIHYEHLVSRFEDTARAMVEAAGEAWHPAVLDYQQTLGNAFVRTPSYAAVGQRVHHGRIGRWKPHRSQMEAVLPILGPWVDLLGVERVAPELTEHGTSSSPHSHSGHT